MSSLLRISAQRDRMSAIERRIADYILENAHLLRDYSSQQLANALEISQSSVVKFSQKLGFKGYPDLKYAISADLARKDGNGAPAAEATPGDDVLDRVHGAQRGFERSFQRDPEHAEPDVCDFHRFVPSACGQRTRTMLVMRSTTDSVRLDISGSSGVTATP